MKYNSIGEYFYQLSNRCLGFTLLPMLCLLAVYGLSYFSLVELPRVTVEEADLPSYQAVIGGLILLMFLSLYFRVRGRTNKLITEPSLGARMNGYSVVVLIRFRAFSIMLLIVGFVVFLSTEISFLYQLIVPLLAVFHYWPSRARIAVDLKLKTEEKEILRQDTLGV